MSNLVGYEGLQARLTAIGDTKLQVRALGLFTVREARLHVARKTGTTGRTIRLARVTEDTATVEVGGAGAFLEHGTRAHIIRPRNRKTLRWPAKGTPVTLGGRARTGAVRALGRGAFAFAKIVRHPGTRAQPFLIPAARKAVETIGAAQIIERWNKAG
jgi:hypothetical protein